MTMKQYYRLRVPEYDRLYQEPEWHDDLSRLRAWLVDCTRGRTILEVAAGTGYWTAAAATAAAAITATDCNGEMLVRMANRRLGAHVTLLTADAYALPEFSTTFDVGMAHLWWSHVEKHREAEFLLHFASRLKPRAMLLMIDQSYVEGFSHPALMRDRAGNRYELRGLANGSVHRIVKNYPTVEELGHSMAGICDDLCVTQLQYFWALRGRICVTPPATPRMR
jgi:SAM-dependent methyltransferase